MDVITIFAIFVFFAEPVLSSVCSSQTTCRNCVLASPECAWCSKEGFKPLRCGLRDKLMTQGCQERSIEFIENEIRIIKNAKLSEMKVATEEEAIQIQPQKIGIKLRRKSLVKFKVHYKQAVDYPVDLYYLMDLSRTMLSHKKTLASLGNKLAEEMKLITKNFRLGFGSFVDKTVLPFTDTNPKKLAVPCAECSPVYGYRNHMSLSTNTSSFSKKVEESSISGNLDGPEGGFDAIMQAIVCREKIGWRKDARHLLIFTSDSTSHLAGDGRLAGLLEPNDEKCHFEDQFYTESMKQDYPSIGQINAVSQDNSVHIIFAIVGEKIKSYQKMVRKIKSSSLAELTKDSSNIVNIIKGEYEKLTSSIQMSDNSSEYLRVSYSSSCLGQEMKQTSVCQDLQVSDEIQFEITVELLSCPLDSRLHRERIKINPMGLEEGLYLDVDMICSCDCQTGNRSIKKSPKCNGHGTFECGICSCGFQTYGEKCECSYKDTNSTKSEEKCFPVTQNSTLPCTGRGHCICGQCSCFEKRGHQYSGPFCECDDMDCEVFNGKICGGPQRGKCNCGVCECNRDYSGPDCSCPTDLRPCTDPLTEKVCNDRGKCICGVCQCNGTDYSGPYCDECPTCSGQCPLFSEIVEKQILLKENYINGSNYESSLVDRLENLIEEKACKFIGKDECVYAFNYKHSRRRYQQGSIQVIVRIQANRRRQCKEPISIGMYSARYISGVVLVGLFTIVLWRLITFLIDRHEYQKFIRSCKDINFPENENPLFKPSTSTFMNPSYVH